MSIQGRGPAAAGRGGQSATRGFGRGSSMAAAGRKAPVRPVVPAFGLDSDEE